ncbi:MAG TPA: DnaJ C-terminal domain-containing protein [Anaerovoracaceae bacterium]|nr:DnaJ C-terminal domain-containing protein [Anaerovoracaceae bacterium]
MNVNEAYKILDLQPGATEDEANKQFRKLATKYHPDTNKDPDAEATYKRYSEALSTIKSAPAKGVGFQNQPGVHVRRSWAGFGGQVDVDLNEIFQTIINGGVGVDFGGGFRRSGTSNAKKQEVVEATLHLTFAEAILGCKKQVVLDKFVKCSLCYGKGFDLTGDCADCEGKGFSITEEKFEDRNLKVRTTCVKCEGLGKHKSNCQKCNKTGSVKAKTTIEVNLPGGIINGSRLKLGGQGNYNRFAGSDFYDDAHISVTVEPEPELSVVGLDVISNLEVSLLEALQGAAKNIKTVKGTVAIKIPDLSKDKDRIFIQGAGVGGRGHQIVTLTVKYPEDTQKLIEFLSKEG